MPDKPTGLDLFDKPLYDPTKRKRGGTTAAKKTSAAPLAGQVPIVADTAPAMQSEKTWRKWPKTLAVSTCGLVTAAWFWLAPALKEAVNHFASEQAVDGLRALKDTITKKAAGNESNKPAVQSATTNPIATGAVPVKAGATVSGNSDDSPAPSRKPKNLSDAKDIKGGELKVGAGAETQNPKLRVLTQRAVEPAQAEVKGPIATAIQLMDQIVTFGKSSGPLKRPDGN